MPKMDYRVPVPEEIKETLNEVGNSVAKSLPTGWGFVLLVFSFGPEGTMTWISNADRNDMLKALAEFIEKQGN